MNEHPRGYNHYFDEVAMMTCLFALFHHTLLSGVVTHIMVTFYEKTFQWSDFSAIELRRSLIHDSRSRRTSFRIKYFVCFVVNWLCLSSRVSYFSGSFATVVMSLPQLYRAKGRWHQQIRVVLGPLTPILAVNNVSREPNNFLTLASLCTCILAFGLLRPDNTAVLDLCCQFYSEKLMMTVGVDKDCVSLVIEYLEESKNRRKAHGMLAALNSILALFSIIFLNIRESDDG